MLGVVGRDGGGYAGRCPPGVPGRGAGVVARAPAGGCVGFAGGAAAGGRTIFAWETTGRFAGVSGRAGCVGLPGSSMRNRIVGGTTRGGAGGGSGAPGASTTGASSTGGAAATGGASTAGGASTRGGSGGGGASTGAAGGGASATAGGGGGAATGAAGSAAGCTGFTVFTRRGGPSTGAVGFGGSAFFCAVAFLALAFGGAGVSANMSPPGSEMPRCRAMRSTNERATTSSIVLDALFSSIP